MSSSTVSIERLRILVACARPMAARLLKLNVTLRTENGGPADESLDAFFSCVQDHLKLTPVDAALNDTGVEVLLSTPFPNLDYLHAELEKLDDVTDVSHATDSKAVDVHRPGEDLGAVLKGLEGLGKAVEVDVLDHARPEGIWIPDRRMMCCIWCATETPSAPCCSRTDGAGCATSAAASWPIW